MKFEKIIFVLFVFSINFFCPKIHAQDSKSPKRFKILNDYGAMPFEDGKTVVADLISTGLNASSETDFISRLRCGYAIEIDLKEGSRYRTGEIKITGAKVFSPQEIKEILELKEGEILDAKKLQDFVYEKLRRIYVDRGYVLYNADFDLHLIEPPVKTSDAIADVEITIDEGKIFKLSKIEFAGVEKERAEELRKLIAVDDGEIFNQRKIEQGINKINETRAFHPIEFNSTAVEIRTSIESETERVEGSRLLRRKGGDEVKKEGGVSLFIKLRKIEQ
ncbi:MAG TPA: POTRA domain-containing protein [Pyrinomonadaceae bacterium]|jgi:outer membrane protein assembly factor BamA